MAVGKTNQLYDMGSMSLKENIYKKVSEFTRENLFIGIPARVVSVKDYEKLQCIDVQPIINDVHTKANNITIEANVITKVFVKLWNSGGWVEKRPVAVGDLVTLHYSHKDLGDWLDSDGSQQIDQNVFEVANIEDCWAELGFGTRKVNNSPSTTDLILESAETTITLKPSGDIDVVTSGNSYIKSAGHTIDADTTITGNLTVNKNTQVDGNTTVTGNTDVTGNLSTAANLTVAGTTTSTGIVTAAAGILAASYAGASATSPAVFSVDMTITGTVVATGSMVINGIALESHKHTDSMGGTTSAPIVEEG